MKKIVIILICCLIYAISFEWIDSRRCEAALGGIFGHQEIPIYPALRKVSEQKMLVNGVEMKVVLLTGEDINIPQVVRYYKAVLAQKGWYTRQGQDDTDNVMTLQFFSKNMDMLSLDFLLGQNFGKSDNHITVRILQTSGRADAPQSDNSTMGNKDIPGFDISWLNRYPESLRVNSVRTEAGYMSVQYKILNYSCLKCVEEFYNQQMLQKDWKFVAMRSKTKEDLLKATFDKEKLDGLLGKILEAANAQPGVSYSKEQLQQLMEKDLPDKPELKEKLNELLKQILEKINAQPSVSYSKEKIKLLLESYFPEEMRVLMFQKGKDVCTITISLQQQVAQVGIVYAPGLASKARTQR